MGYKTQYKVKCSNNIIYIIVQQYIIIIIFCQLFSSVEQTKCLIAEASSA